MQVAALVHGRSSHGAGEEETSEFLLARGGKKGGGERLSLGSVSMSPHRQPLDLRHTAGRGSHGRGTVYGRIEC